MSVQSPVWTSLKDWKDSSDSEEDVALKWLGFLDAGTTGRGTRPPAGSESSIRWTIHNTLPGRETRLCCGTDFVRGAAGLHPATERTCRSNARITAGGCRTDAPVLQSDPRKQFAIVLDGQVISTSVLDGALSGDSVRIAGNLRRTGRTTLPPLMRAGPLPVSLTSSKSVPSSRGRRRRGGKRPHGGPDRGHCVAACMIGFYGFFGVVAVIAVIVNVVLIIAVLSVTGRHADIGPELPGSSSRSELRSTRNVSHL